MQTDQFNHVYFANTYVNQAHATKYLHIYIEGDGTPWINGAWVAPDPTPRNPVMLNLLQLDSSPAILLGRPCYHQSKVDKNCRTVDWTMGRYSAAVVDSMVAAIRRLQSRLNFSGIALFGHSGGGALAMLIADKINKEGNQTDAPQLSAIVTIAANLDTAKWAAEHGYLPLDLSLNPALTVIETPPLVLHLFGNRDNVVDADLFTDYFYQRPNETKLVLQGFEHACCWAAIWPTILQRVHAVQNSPRNPAVSE